MSSTLSFTGEAPQLSGSYGQYDNGASVFANYWNFSGTSLSGWTGYTNGGTETEAASNGLTIQVSSAGQGGVYSSTAISSGIAMDALVSANSTDAMCIQGHSASISFCEDVVEGPRWGIGSTSAGTISGWLSVSSASAPVGNANYVLTGYYISGSSTLLVNYANVSLTSSTAFSGSTNMDSHAYSSSSGSGYAQWVRTRAYPPSGVMPLASEAVNGSTIVIFPGSGTTTWTVPAGVTSVSYLVVGGGGSGGGYVGGGGGGGGVLSGTGFGVSGTVNVTVGAGGSLGSPGGNSVFGTLIAYGGGNGATGGGMSTYTASSGGSGGGGGSSSGTVTAGSGTSGQGYAGGTSSGPTSNYGSGGGGGASSAGGAGGSIGGAGGNGVSSSITGTAVTYGGGGGGACSDNAGGSNCYGLGGGSGGRGAQYHNDGSVLSSAVAGTAGMGSGGGGGGNLASVVASMPGGSGVVIIAYPTP